MKPIKSLAILLVATVSFSAAQRNVYTVTATAYTSHQAQTDSNPNETATGSKARLGTLALSRDLLAKIPYGSKVKINAIPKSKDFLYLENMVFVVEDTMHKRWSNKIDIWLPDYKTALKFGKQKVILTVIEYAK